MAHRPFTFPRQTDGLASIQVSLFERRAHAFPQCLLRKSSVAFPSSVCTDSPAEPFHEWNVLECPKSFELLLGPSSLWRTWSPANRHPASVRYLRSQFYPANSCIILRKPALLSLIIPKLSAHKCCISGNPCPSPPNQSPAPRVVLLFLHHPLYVLRQFDRQSRCIHASLPDKSSVFEFRLAGFVTRLSLEVLHRLQQRRNNSTIPIRRALASAAWAIGQCSPHTHKGWGRNCSPANSIGESKISPRQAQEL